LNEQYLERAKEKVQDVRALINAAAKRAAELARGARPLVSVLPQDDRSFLDIALLEIAEDKIRVDIPKS
jgi:DNA-directed RNA polymerase subunit K/omega